MNDTLVTRLKSSASENDLRVFTHDGRFMDYFLGRYYDKCYELDGYELNDDELDAFKDFIDDGKAKGWINYVRYFQPMYGTLSRYKMASAPLIDQVLNYDAYINTNSGLFSYDANDKIVGYKSELDFMFRVALKPRHMNGGISFIATGVFNNLSGGVCGYRWENDGMCSFRSLRSAGYEYPTWKYSNSPNNSGDTINFNMNGITTGVEAALGFGLWKDPSAQGTVHTNRVYLSADGTSSYFSLKYDRTTDLVLPPEDASPLLLGLYTTAGTSRHMFKNFASIDPEMPETMIRSFIAAAFELNIALGKTEVE